MLELEHKISEEELVVIQNVSYWLRGMNTDHRVLEETREAGIDQADKLDIIINRVCD